MPRRRRRIPSSPGPDPAPSPGAARAPSPARAPTPGGSPGYPSSDPHFQRAPTPGRAPSPGSPGGYSDSSSLTPPPDESPYKSASPAKASASPSRPTLPKIRLKLGAVPAVVPEAEPEAEKGESSVGRRRPSVKKGKGKVADDKAGDKDKEKAPPPAPKRKAPAKRKTDEGEPAKKRPVAKKTRAERAMYSSDTDEATAEPKAEAPRAKPAKKTRHEKAMYTSSEPEDDDAELTVAEKKPARRRKSDVHGKRDATPAGAGVEEPPAKPKTSPRKRAAALPDPDESKGADEPKAKRKKTADDDEPKATASTSPKKKPAPLDDEPKLVSSTSPKKKLPQKRSPDGDDKPVPVDVDKPKRRPLDKAPIKKRPPPAGSPAGTPRRAAPAPRTSLLASTLKSLSTQAAPERKEDKVERPRAGTWGEELVLTPEQQAQYAASAVARRHAAADRARASVHPLNLQEAKDAYRADSAHAGSRVIPVPGGTGIVTTGLPSRMVAAVLAGNVRS